MKMKLSMDFACNFEQLTHNSFSTIMTCCDEMCLQVLVEFLYANVCIAQH